MAVERLEEELKFFIENKLIPQIRLIMEDDKTLNKQKVMKIAIKQFITSLTERYKESMPNFETVMQQMLAKALKEMDLESVIDCLNIGAVTKKEEGEEQER